MFQEILFRKQDQVGTIILNRPQKKNAMSEQMGREITQVVEQINADRTVRVVIITGAGDTFSAGGDLDMIVDLTQKSEEESYHHMLQFYKLFYSIQELAVPTIAMINGHAIGAGFCFALACDLRTIAEQARVGLTFVKVGLNVGMGGTYSLPRVMNQTKALELLLTGKMVRGTEAFELGIVNRVFCHEELPLKTLEFAHQIAQNSPVAVKFTKRSFYTGLNSTVEHVFESEANGQSHCYKTKDILEGVTAVREKRSPHFIGE
jgi:enoyl-CoA hydratase